MWVFFCFSRTREVHSDLPWTFSRAHMWSQGTKFNLEKKIVLTFHAAKMNKFSSKERILITYRRDRNTEFLMWKQKSAGIEIFSLHKQIPKVTHLSNLGSLADYSQNVSRQQKSKTSVGLWVDIKAWISKPGWNSDLVQIWTGFRLINSLTHTAVLSNSGVSTWAYFEAHCPN